MTGQVELLTGRERECLRLVDRHFSSKQIARELGMSKTSVDTYCDRARAKLGVGDRYHAARLLADHERAAQAARDPVLTTSGQDAVRTDAAAGPWSDLASSGGETHEALERTGRQDGRPENEQAAANRAAVNRAIHLRREIEAFETRWPTPSPRGASMPGFCWTQLERQLTDLAASPTQADMVKPLISATRKLAAFKPPEMVMREILCITWVLLDENFHPGEADAQMA